MLKCRSDAIYLTEMGAFIARRIKDGLIVERDLQDVNQLNGRIPADVVNGLHVFAGRIDLLL